ncbi:N,N-dimethylformamidase beta subunit family domain-containing protein [Burkholderia sp. Bp9140]|uniref:N,N-dimethylformamidase beta subunit family domain-containing protein n=1 Tax=Burkholderia sp. Bp9140 TaxID=2184572 RepID=UPI000F57076B|nr:N,N-dimethylformamidase beta subunit family domain-containing protein [Burkholderia sp. Bp9140]
MKIVGYSDRISVQQGGRISFHVSSELDEYSAKLVRLRHGDTNPRGPGFRQTEVPSSVDGAYRGSKFGIASGSYADFSGLSELGRHAAMRLEFKFLPTSMAAASQSIVALDADGWRLLVLLEDGKIILSTFDGASVEQRALSTIDLCKRRWVACQIDINAESGEITLNVRDTESKKSDDLRVLVKRSRDVLLERVYLAAHVVNGGAPANHFNGKIGGLSLMSIDTGDGGYARPLCNWNMGLEISSKVVIDECSYSLHGRLVNRPARGVTSAEFDGSVVNPVALPAHYDAVHFHEDDIEDAQWPVAFSFSVPADLPSGVYAYWLTGADGAEDYIPFFVTPSPSGTRARIAFLAPVFSYLAYANYNNQTLKLMGDLAPHRDQTIGSDEHEFIVKSKLLSTYDHHRDGSGVSLAAVKRPQLLAFRPKSRAASRNTPQQFGFDLYIVDWLMELGFEFDVVTDCEVHSDGLEALAPYSVVISGSHAEYVSGQILDALAAYQEQGGNFMYLSGNGLYWVTALSDDGDMIEVQRPAGTRPWNGWPGQGHISLTGEPGGLWRDRGRAPNRYVGIGMASQGFDRGCGYVRTEASFQPAAQFVFDGVDDTVIGDFPALSLTWGAAGFEIDRVDHDLGSPAGVIVLATARDFTDQYQVVIEDCNCITGYQGGRSHGNVRADMVLYTVPGGGHVFSVGSINWSSCLSYNGYDNNVSRVTANVLRKFACLPSVAAIE